MKQFLIRYRLTNATPEAWHQEIGKFISALDNDAELKGRIAYRDEEPRRLGLLPCRLA